MTHLLRRITDNEGDDMDDDATKQSRLNDRLNAEMIEQHRQAIEHAAQYDRTNELKRNELIDGNGIYTDADCDEIVRLQECLVMIARLAPTTRLSIQSLVAALTTIMVDANGTDADIEAIAKQMQSDRETEAHMRQLRTKGNA